MSPLPKSARLRRPGVYRDAEGRIWIQALVTVPSTTGGTTRARVGPRMAEKQGEGKAFEALAEAELERRKDDRRAGRRAAAARPAYTVASYHEAVLLANPARESTQALRQHRAAHWLPMLGELRLDAVAAEDIRDAWAAIMAKGLAPSTLSEILSSLGRPFRQAHREGLISVDPVAASGIRAPRTPKRSLDRLDASRIRPVLAHAVERYPQHVAFYVLCWSLGLRPGEALGIRPAHITRGASGPTLTIPETKTGQPRTVPLSARHLLLIDEHRKRHGSAANDSAPLFVSVATGRAYSLQAPRGCWGNACEAAGIDGVRLHDLRASFVALSAALGVRRYVRAQITGHADQGIDDHYDGVFAGEVRAAVEVVAEYVFGVLDDVRCVGGDTPSDTPLANVDSADPHKH